MEFVDLDIDEQYSRFAELKQSKGEVIKLLEWVHQQPHLPKLNELEVMLFYHSCHYHTEMAKQVIDLLYTTKTHCPEFFKNYDPAHDQLQMAMEEVSVASLPNLTPDGNQVLLVRLRNSDASKFNFAATLKLCILAVEHLLITKGLVAGYVLVVDLKGVTLSHVTRLGPLTMKKFLFFLQEAAPIRIAGLHFINIVSFVDKILALMKPFLKAELMNVLHLHSNLETFYKFVPQKILPTEYGGDEKTLEDLKDEVQKIVTWSGKEAHLPNLEEWEVIRFFHACLYSVEVTKQCIDLHYTTRTHCPDIFQNFDPWCERIQLAMDVMAIAPLTKLTPEGNKVIISRLNDLDSHKFHYVDIVRLYFMVFEFLLGTEGILKGYTMVFDLTNSSLGHVARIGPATLKKFLFIIQDAPHFRTTGIHFVNILPLVDKLIALLKPFLRQPLMNNLHSHTSLESFYKFAPKDILPVEYGGCEPALETISGKVLLQGKLNFC